MVTWFMIVLTPAFYVYTFEEINKYIYIKKCKSSQSLSSE